VNVTSLKFYESFLSLSETNMGPFKDLRIYRRLRNCYWFAQGFGSPSLPAFVPLLPLSTYITIPEFPKRR
jgi:hypothetical protein